MTRQQQSCCQPGGSCGPEKPVSPSEYTIHSSSRRRFLSRTVKVSVGAIIASAVCESLQARAYLYRPPDPDGLLGDFCCLIGTASSKSTDPKETYQYQGFEASVASDIEDDITAPQGWTLGQKNISVSFTASSQVEILGVANANVSAPNPETGTSNQVFTPFTQAQNDQCKLHNPGVHFSGSAAVVGSASGSVVFEKTLPGNVQISRTGIFTGQFSGSSSLIPNGDEYFDSGYNNSSSVRYSCATGSWQLGFKCLAEATIYTKARLQLAGQGSGSVTYEDENDANQTHGVAYAFSTFSEVHDWKGGAGISVKLENDCPKGTPEFHNNNP